jgi:phosphoribosylaminoimidazolecarboxamide formyltransferase/IMP cyclohydrolase
MGAPITWKVSTERAPTSEEEGALRFAWGIVQHVKSNAIVLARAEDGGYVLNGVGAGQMSRVDSVRLAISKATRPVEGSVLASDAFFPFTDGVEVALKAGVEAIIQPGGSIRDDAVVAAVNESNGSMVCTGARHFRH